jgi:hypothetical protein
MTARSPAEAAPRGYASRLRRLARFVGCYGIVLVLLGLSAISAVASPYFLTMPNLFNVALQANPDLAGIYFANDTMALGGAEAVTAAGKEGAIILIGTDQELAQSHKLIPAQLPMGSVEQTMCIPMSAKRW